MDSCIVIFVKQKTAYEMRISDWSFRRVLFRSARIALILLEARWRAGGERGERARHHLAQRSHVPRIKAGSSFIRRDVEKSLLQYGAAIDAVVDPEQCASRYRFIGQAGPGVVSPSTAVLQAVGCVTNTRSFFWFLDFP